MTLPLVQALGNMQSAWTTVTSIYGVVVVITMLVVFCGIRERVGVSAADNSRRPRTTG